MAFDGLITKLISKELNNTLTNSKINKIYEPNSNEIILELYNKEKFYLNICISSSNCRINLTSHLKENPKIAPNFCMILRKYLTSARIVSINSYNLDRIIIINLENYNELNDLVQYNLIVELMGKHSNIILLNSENIIIDAIRKINSIQSLRTILPNNKFSFIKSEKFNFNNISSEEFIKIINTNKTSNLLNDIPNLFCGFSKSFIVYSLKYLNINEFSFNDNELLKLYNYIFEILNINATCTTFENNKKTDYTLTTCNKNITNLNINHFIDNYYFEKENYEIFINHKNNALKLILSTISKYNKKISTLNQKLDICLDMEKFKIYGELLTCNLYKINNNINIDSIELENYYDNNNFLLIPLDKKYSPSYNAKKYFKLYNKLKNTHNIVTIQKKEIENEIKYLESVLYSLENCITINEINEIYLEINENIFENKKNKQIKQKKEVTDITPVLIDGYEVYVGKNNNQNDIISFKIAKNNDIWFHIQDFTGSHVILKTNGQKIDDDNPIILKCAKLALKNSKACFENKAIVDYTLSQNLKKPKNSKPGFVIFDEFKSIIVENNEI